MAAELNLDEHVLPQRPRYQLMNALLKFDPMVTQNLSVISKIRLCEVVKTAHQNRLNDCSIGKEQFMMLTSENLVLQKS